MTWPICNKCGKKIERAGIGDFIKHEGKWYHYPNCPEEFNNDETE